MFSSFYEILIFYVICFDLNARGFNVHFSKILMKNFENVGGIKESHLVAHVLLNSIKHISL